jgi:hypothetical protein
MTRSPWLHGAGLFLAFGLGTWLVGWWAIPTITLGWGLLTAGRIRSWVPGVSADTRSGAFGRLLGMLAGVLHTPEVVLLLLTLVFPGFLAWGGAKLGVELARRTPQDTVSRPESLH